MQELDFSNPTEIIDLDFGNYLRHHSCEISAHLVDGVPDYAFPLDQKLCQQLKKMAPVRTIAQYLTSLSVSYENLNHQMESVAVSSQQLPEIYAIGQECARRLGIDIPKIFVSSKIFNTFTIATDNVAPIIVLPSSLVGLPEPELKFIIGRECGHIHNLHGVYNTAAQLITKNLYDLAQMKVISTIAPNLELLEGIIKYIVDKAIKILFFSWSLSQEITCDRAGLICSGNIEVAQKVLLDFAPDDIKKIPGFNLEAYLQQREQVPLEVRISNEINSNEIIDTANLNILVWERIQAIRKFANCEVFCNWYPQLASNTTVEIKADVDDWCEKYISIFREKSQQ